MFQRLRILLGLSLLIGASLACSIGGNPVLTSTAEPVTAPTTTAPTIIPPTKVQTAVPTVGGEVLPTDTATLTPTPTATDTLTPTPTTTNTLKPRPATAIATKKPVSTGPLTINYEVVGITSNPDNQSVLTLKVVATGGAGGYTYYHDDQKQAGATFDVPGSCGHPFVHTIKVTSADGQTATLPYFVGGLCPSPTPKP